MTVDYEKLLKRGLDKVPAKEKSGERFEMPVLRVQKSGSRSILVNYSEVAGVLRRDPKHLMKFLLKELATSGEAKGSSIEVQGVFNQDVVNKKLEKYVEGYVKCPECSKHDTNLVKERGFFFLKCEVCGAREPVGKV
jgi:translation initiation factor 2 subunit 2